MRANMIARMERVQHGMMVAMMPRTVDDRPKLGWRAPVVPPIMQVKPVTATCTLAEALIAKQQAVRV
jgi:hypothetical protein